MCLQVKELFELYDKDNDHSLTLNELAVMLQDIGNKITSLPAVRSSYTLLTLNHHLTNLRLPKLPPNKANTLGRNFTD